MTVLEITRFLEWTLIINVVIFVVATCVVTVKQEFLVRFHKTLFGVSKEDLLKSYFNYLGGFKILIIIFNFSPYVALRIMG